MVNKETNSTYKKNALTVGILFIIATAFLFIGESFYGPALETPDYLQTAFPNRTAATIGMLIEFSCILSIALIPVFAYPVLRKHSEPLAIAYVVFRAFEAVLFVLVDITKLSLVKVSELYLSADGPTAVLIENIGATIQGWNEWAWVFYVFIFGFGALIFYTMLFRSKLLPRWISISGLVSIALMLSSAVLAMFAVEIPESVFGLLVIPIGAQEMVMAIRMIIKGFDAQYLEA